MKDLIRSQVHDASVVAQTPKSIVVREVPNVVQIIPINKK